MKHKRHFLSIALFFIMPIVIYAGSPGRIIISEFLASNSTTLQDEDGEYSDWIELYNPGSTSINLQGWRLTDSKNKPGKWIFPSVSIGAGKYLIVFASSKDRAVANKELHTNFGLSKEGEYLAIIEPDGTISHEYTPAFPVQQSDVSYGYYEGGHHYFEIPTPGEENTLETKAQIPVFSVGRGFFSNAFNVSLSVSDSETKIYYTTDGTRPTTQSTPYTGAISITRTTPLSAVGIKNGVASRVVTNTYWFITDIVNQPDDPSGYPDSWGYLGSDVKYDNYAVGERAPADYAMDANICNNPAYKNQIEDAFLSIPSMSIVTNPGYLFSEDVNEDEGGIYIYTGATALGDGWERPVSIEYYDPATEKQFQINCGLRIHGAASRQPEKSGKHSFRAVFRKAYGNGKLKFDLFEKETAVKEFDHLVLRAGYNISWVHPEEGQRKNSQYTIDSFAKRTQLNMGQLSTHDRFVHLFINGLYWGLYDISERINDKFMEAYFDGEDVDFDVINHNGLAEGNKAAYDRMIQLAKAGEYEQLLSEKLLNMENYIDYMILNFYIGNQDWPHNNWYAARNRKNPENGFCFFSWDAETSFTDVNQNRINAIGGDFRRILFGTSNGYSDTGGLYNNKEFKLLFADRVHKHFFNNGDLTPEKAAGLFEQVNDEIDLAIILESARWGDYRKNVLTPRGSSPALYTRDHWLARKENLLKKYFPERTEIVYQQLYTVGLVSEIAPPFFSSYEGNVDNNPLELAMSAFGGTVYYTTDGTDPREKGSGNVAASGVKYSTALLISKGCTIKARSKNGTQWSALSEAKFTGGGDTSTTTIALDHIREVYYSNNSLHFTLPEDGNTRIEIYAVDGKCVQVFNVFANAGTNQVELSGISQGVYIYKISFNGMAYSGKFIK